MADEHPSRNATLADVLARIDASNVGDKKRGELASAIRTVGKVLGRPPEEIRADAESLRRRLNDISSVTADMSPGRWANVRSLLRAALVIAGVGLFSRPTEPMSLEWCSLYRQLSRWARVR